MSGETGYVDRCLECGSVQWNPCCQEGSEAAMVRRKCCGRTEIIKTCVTETEAAALLAQLARERATPPASRYLEAYIFARGHTGSGRVLAQLLLNLYNSEDFPLTTTYGLHGVLDSKRRKLALDCIARYAEFGENDDELLQVGRKLAKEWPDLRRDWRMNDSLS